MHHIDLILLPLLLPLSASITHTSFFQPQSCSLQPRIQSSGYDIESQTGASNATISRLCSRHCPYIKMSSGGCPSKLSEQDLCYAIWLIGTGKAENAVQVTKTFQHSTNQSVSAQTVQNGMNKVGMDAVVKTTYYQTS